MRAKNGDSPAFHAERLSPFFLVFERSLYKKDKEKEKEKDKNCTVQNYKNKMK